MVIIVLGVLLVVAALSSHSNNDDIDKQYYDEDGLHKYYERSIIEKRDFKKNNPNSSGIRTFRRLFCRSKK